MLGCAVEAKAGGKLLATQKQGAGESDTDAESGQFPEGVSSDSPAV